MNCLDQTDAPDLTERKEGELEVPTAHAGPVVPTVPTVPTLSLDDADAKMSEADCIMVYGKGNEKGFKLTRKAALQSEFFAKTLEDPKCTEIRLDKVKDDVLHAIVAWLEYHVVVPPRRIDKPLRSSNMADIVDEFDVKFTNVDQDTMFDIMLIANYLLIIPLLELMCAKCASTLKGKTPAEIRKAYNIRDDFTPEEEEEVRKAHADLLT